VHLVNRDPDLRALIIIGTGDVFSAGGDMGGRAGPGDEPVPDISSDTLPFLTIRDSRAPVVAAVNGLCQAGRPAGGDGGGHLRRERPSHVPGA
jgi:enoyl-CoA hydratase